MLPCQQRLPVGLLVEFAGTLAAEEGTVWQLPFDSRAAQRRHSLAAIFPSAASQRLLLHAAEEASISNNSTL